MPRPAASRRPSLASFIRLLVIAAGCWTAGSLRAYDVRGFNTVVIDAGHGGLDRGGGPGQIIPEKPYTLDTAIRLEKALHARGFRTVMTRTDDVFVPLPERVNTANLYPDAVFISVHYNSAPRPGAHGYETYYYRADSFGLATRLHRAQLATLNTEDRFVRRRGFYVLRKPNIPAVLLEGGFLTSPEESRVVLDASYRQRWAENIADALVAQRREGNPSYLGSQPAVTTEHLGSSRGRSRHHSRGGGGSRHHRSTHGSTHRGSTRSTTHHHRRHSS